MAIPGVDRDAILGVQEERQVGNDNCVSVNRLKLKIPESRRRAHFVKARVKLRQYPAGTDAIFPAPRCLGRFAKTGILQDERQEARQKARKAASIRAAAELCNGGQGQRLAHSSTGEQKPKKRPYDVLPKAAKLISYRQFSFELCPRGDGFRRGFLA